MKRLAMALFALCACSEQAAPDVPSLDGNVIVGDALVDLGPPGADVADLGPDEDLGMADLPAFDTGLDEDAGVDLGIEDMGPPDLGDPCALMPVATLTSSQAVAELSTYAGMVVEIVGVLEQGDLECTDNACTKADPCCNLCTAPVRIDQRVTLAQTACFTPAPGCSGTNCAQTCRPPLLGLSQRFSGRLMDVQGEPRLEILRID